MWHFLIGTWKRSSVVPKAGTFKYVLGSLSDFLPTTTLCNLKQKKDRNLSANSFTGIRVREKYVDKDLEKDLMYLIF